jgi:hypothetical protein
LYSSEVSLGRPQRIDGIDKLPDPFVQKLLDYHLFSPEGIAFTSCKLDGKDHVKKNFVKERTKIASDEEVKLLHNV